MIWGACMWKIWLSVDCLQSNELSMQVKQAILNLWLQKKHIWEIVTILRVVKPTVWYILKKKKALLNSAKRPGLSRTTIVVVDHRIISVVKRKLQPIYWRIFLIRLCRKHFKYSSYKSSKVLWYFGWWFHNYFCNIK